MARVLWVHVLRPLRGPGGAVSEAGWEVEEDPLCQGNLELCFKIWVETIARENEEVIPGRGRSNPNRKEQDLFWKLDRVLCAKSEVLYNEWWDGATEMEKH